MAELLAYLARELVDDPDAVRVETEERESLSQHQDCRVVSCGGDAPQPRR